MRYPLRIKVLSPFVDLICLTVLCCFVVRGNVGSGKKTQPQRSVTAVETLSIRSNRITKYAIIIKHFLSFTTLVKVLRSEF